MTGVSGIVLAGGQGRRMGGVDKGLQPLRGKPMIEWVLARLAPQVSEVIVNANQNIPSYEKYGHRVVPDEIWLPTVPARAPITDDASNGIIRIFWLGDLASASSALM